MAQCFLRDRFVRMYLRPPSCVADIEKCASTQLPLETNSIDEFLLSHVIEHVHASLDLMQELYRLAKPNAKATIRVPLAGERWLAVLIVASCENSKANRIATQ